MTQSRYRLFKVMEMCNLEFFHGLHPILTQFGFIFLFRKRKLSNAYQVNKDNYESQIWICAFLYRRRDKFIIIIIIGFIAVVIVIIISFNATMGPFLEAPGKYRACEAALFSIPDGSFKSFENCTAKLSAKETKLTSLEIRTHTFLDMKGRKTPAL